MIVQVIQIMLNEKTRKKLRLKKYIKKKVTELVSKIMNENDKMVQEKRSKKTEVKKIKKMTILLSDKSLRKRTAPRMLKSRLYIRIYLT